MKAQLVECQFVNLWVIGSNCALVILSLFSPKSFEIYSVSFPFGSMVDTTLKGSGHNW